jgi:hypothetical protein
MVGEHNQQRKTEDANKIEIGVDLTKATIAEVINTT